MIQFQLGDVVRLDGKEAGMFLAMVERIESVQHPGRVLVVFYDDENEKYVRCWARPRECVLVQESITIGYQEDE